MTSERDKLIDIIKPAGAHDYWPQKAADYILGSGWLAEHDAALIEKLADEFESSTVKVELFGSPEAVWWRGANQGRAGVIASMRARAAEIREGNRA